MFITLKFISNKSSCFSNEKIIHIPSCLYGIIVPAIFIIEKYMEIGMTYKNNLIVLAITSK